MGQCATVCVCVCVCVGVEGKVTTPGFVIDVSTHISVLPSTAKVSRHYSVFRHFLISPIL